MAYQQKNPYSWAENFAQQANARGAQESAQAQNALMAVFQTEAARQRPYVGLPVDLAKMNASADRSMVDFNARADRGLQDYKERFNYRAQNGQRRYAKADVGLGVNIARKLSEDLNLPLEITSGLAGNLFAETGGFKNLQEIKPVVPGSRGGYGWAQWTGPRRKAFEAWSAQNKLNPSTPEANYGFLIHELTQTDEGRRLLPKLRAARTPEEAADIVMNVYLRPGVKRTGERRSASRKIYEDAVGATGRSMFKKNNSADNTIKFEGKEYKLTDEDEDDEDGSDS